MGREGHGPVEVITAVPGEGAGDFGDGTKWMGQETPPASSAGSKKSGRERRTTHMGGFGKKETDNPVRR